MATSNDLIEKIRTLLGDEAADVARQHQEISAKLEKAKVDLTKAEQKKADAETAANEVVSGLTTRQTDVEQRERDISAREAKVVEDEKNHEMTAHALGLREQALLPQEEDIRRRSIELSTKENEATANATELAQLQDELSKWAKELEDKETALNATRDKLKQVQEDLLKKQG